MLKSSSRQARILEIIQAKDIETQGELANELEKLSIHVTQATISRDIKRLRLTKIMNENGKYIYGIPDNREQNLDERMIHIFAQSVQSVRSSDNLLVIKTYPGNASAAAEVIDSMNLPTIIGTLAGDNTILVVARTDEDVPKLMSCFQEMRTGKQ